MIHQVHLRNSWEFLHDPFSKNYAKSVRTNKFVVGFKIKIVAYFTS